MNLFRDTLIKEKPFKEFELSCSECDELLVELSDLTESPAKNEALILYRINDHSMSTNHYSFDSLIDPVASLHNIDTQITVNDDRLSDYI